MPSQLPPCRATALFIALTPQEGKRSFSDSLSVCLSLLIVFFGVFYFLNVLIPHLEGELRLSPQLLWQPLFASEKVHLKGPTKCATTCLSIVLHRCSKCGHIRHVRWWRVKEEKWKWKCFPNVSDNTFFYMYKGNEVIFHYSSNHLQ